MKLQKYKLGEPLDVKRGVSLTGADKIKDCVVWIPDLEEQKRIASILSALDNKIALNREINRNLLFSTLLFWGNTNKIPHNYPKDDYADKSHGEPSVRKQVTFRVIHDAMECRAEKQRMSIGCHLSYSP